MMSNVLLRPVRTTLDLDEDIVSAAKQLASQRGMTTGQVISDLARKGLAPKGGPRMRNGVPVFGLRAGELKRGAMRPDLALVNRLRDE